MLKVIVITCVICYSHVKLSFLNSWKLTVVYDKNKHFFKKQSKLNPLYVLCKMCMNLQSKAEIMNITKCLPCFFLD